jgi:putative ABC transport system permease protein
MLASYLLSALRAIQRDPWHAAVNVGGLAVALAASLLIALYARRELSYENFIRDPSSVYRVEEVFAFPGRSVDHTTMSSYQVAEALSADLGDHLAVTTFTRRQAVIEAGGAKSRRLIAVGDEHFFDVLDLPIIAGDGAAAMKEPGAILLGRQVARELLGADPAEALGRILRLNGADVRVAAVLEDPPANTDHPVDIMVSVATQAFAPPPQLAANWGAVGAEIFIRIKSVMSSEAVAAALPGVVARHKPPSFSMGVTLKLRPLTALHLAGGPGPRISNANRIALGALGGTAAFLIFIACFSYINLATARSFLRAREAGLRKVMGGRAADLAAQFMMESTLIAATAFALALVASAALLPVFGNLVGRRFGLSDLADPMFMAAAAGLLTFVALLAGAYPAVVLASQKPVDLVRSKQGGSSGVLRIGIVTLQFGLTSALLIAAVVAFAQLLYLRNFDLGFARSGLLVIRMGPDQVADGRDRVLREELAKSPLFSGATWSSAAPGTPYAYYLGLQRPGDDSGSAPSVFNLSVGSQFFDVYGVKPLAGRVFSDDLDIDRMASPSQDQPVAHAPAVLTASAASFLGFRSPEDAVGKELILPAPAGQTDLTIVGVVPDFYFDLGRQARSPTVFFPWGRAEQNPGEVTARVKPGAAGAAVAEARAIWSGLFPDETLTFQFIEDRIAQANTDDDRQSRLFGFFSGLALLVSCLGLFALASFVAARRTHEIAVRKVLGASTPGVVRLLLWDFAKPVLLANVIAWPLAYAMVTPWLARFPYHIKLSPWLFLGVSALSLLVAMLTISTRSIAAARARPAIVLRTE